MILFGVIAMIVGAALVFVVVIQNSKGGGLSSTFAGGGATQMLGARRSSEFIEKVTWYLAAGVAVLAFLANIVGSGGATESSGLRIEQNVDNQIIQNQVQDVSGFQDSPEGVTEELIPAEPEAE
ncbi:MAG: preprotein translocase subunit SecG [Bacteroidia bacterium]|nr:preprotein translocase subunit SecG [Bacteroidia bacterium]